MNDRSPTSDPSVRFHDLDALRAVAMLLGILLHAMLSFVEVPIWPAQDRYQNSFVYGFFVDAMHGFRLPLFFLLSGFFTTMLWRKRGMGALVAHRTKRILLPMMLALVVVWPVLIGIAIWGGFAKAHLAEQRASAPQVDVSTIWTAARDGDSSAIAVALDGGANIDGWDGIGATPLYWATLYGHADAITLLIERGANVNAGNKDGATSLHIGALFGRRSAVELLLSNGADINKRNLNGDTALDHSEMPDFVVQMIAGAVQVDPLEVTSGRPGTAELFKTAGAAHGGLFGTEQGDGMRAFVGIWKLGAFFPVFHHLWFLYYLCLLLIIFVVVASMMSKLRIGVPQSLVTSPLRWLWLIPMTVAAQFMMVQGFGADTAGGILPWPPKLMYYGVFFGFGALCYGKPRFHDRAGAWWPLWFVLAIPAFLAARHCIDLRVEAFYPYQLLYSLCAAVYAWLMIYGSIGVFRRYCRSDNPRFRYVSDSAYWLYLAHLPLVMALQIMVMSWSMPSYIKLTLICVVATPILVISYEYMVRYTWIGAMLNGRKYREPRVAIEEATDSSPAN